VHVSKRHPAAIDRMAATAAATAAELSRLADQAGRMGREKLAKFLADRAAELRGAAA
jgi:hypothetical protein